MNYIVLPFPPSANRYRRTTMYWLLGAIVVYLAASVGLCCYLKRRAMRYRVHRPMHDVMDDGGCWNPGVKRW